MKEEKNCCDTHISSACNCQQSFDEKFAYATLIVLFPHSIHITSDTAT